MVRLGALPPLLLLLFLATPALGDQETPAPEGPQALVERVCEAWRARDLDGYLASWAFASPEARESERAFAVEHFAADHTELVVERPGTWPVASKGFRLGSRIASVSEPRGRFERWLFALEPRQAGWKLVHKKAGGHIDGLLHLSLSPRGYKADGLTLQFEDFAMRMSRGTLFTSPASIGPTVLVFVGEGRALISPRPTAERQQLELFSGKPTLATKVRWAYIRIHPADLHRVLTPTRLAEAPASASRLRKAREVFEEYSRQSYLLDAPIPGSPWWVLPSPRDGSVTFETSKHGTLTFAVNRGDPESINLFDREDRRQILLYPAKGRAIEYDEDEGRAIDVLHHDISVRFDPQRLEVQGTDTLHLRLVRPTNTVRLALDDELAVRSVRSAGAGRHLFFRVRNQNSLLVSLGPLAGQLGELKLTVTYGGRLPPDEIESEALQIYRDSPRTGNAIEEFHIEPVLVYANRRAWYPRPRPDDYATARLRFDVPRPFTVLTGGQGKVVPDTGERRIVQYEMDRPGRYFTAVVGRLQALPSRQVEGMLVRGYAVSRARDAAGKLLDRTADIVSFFSDEFGPFPYSSLSLVTLEGRTPGGHSPPGMVLMQLQPVLMRRQLRDDPAKFDDVEGFFLAHELAHQWWGHGVAGQSYHERWLSEGLAQYAAALWARRAHGEKTFREILERMGRWAHRVSDKGPISLGYRLGHIDGDRRIYRAIVYNKAAYVLHMLRGIVGDEAFREGLRRLQERHRFEKLGTTHLQEALEAASGRDLDGYFRAWIHGTRHPTLSWSHRISPATGGYETQIRVQASHLPGEVPLQLSVEHQSGHEVEKVMLAPDGGSFTIRTPTRPRKIRVNDDLGLLAEVKRK